MEASSGKSVNYINNDKIKKLSYIKSLMEDASSGTAIRKISETSSFLAACWRARF